MNGLLNTEIADVLTVADTLKYVVTPGNW